MASMYVAMLPVDWKILRTTPDMEAGDDPDYEITLTGWRWRCGCVSYRVGSVSGCTDGAWSRLSRCLTVSVTGSGRAGLLWCRYSLRIMANVFYRQSVNTLGSCSGGSLNPSRKLEGRETKLRTRALTTFPLASIDAPPCVIDLIMSPMYNSSHRQSES